MDILGDEVLIDWFEHTHFLHPEAELGINDFGILMGGGFASQQENLKYLISILQDASAPLHRLGFQSHFTSYLPSPEVIFDILEDFSVYGLNIHISEFDINIDDMQAQADFTRDFMTIMFSHPSVNRFTKWGFWEQTMATPKGAMFRTDWTEKPNYFAYTDLVFNQWWTEEVGLSDENGEFFVRGFLGDYEITVLKDGLSSTLDTVLVKDGTTVTLVLKNPTYCITASAGNYGHIEPAGEIIIVQGSDQLFFIDPDEGFYTDKIIINDVETDLDNDINWNADNRTYTFSNVTQDHTIHAEFALKTFILSFQILDANTGNNIEDATITLNDDQHDTGVYVFEKLSPETYLYKVNREQYFESMGETEIVNEDVHLIVQLQADYTSIKDLEDFEVKVFPNPARNTLFVEANMTITDIHIIDILGRPVISVKVQDMQNELDVSNLHNGIYFIRVFTDRGVKTIRVMVVE